MQLEGDWLWKQQARQRQTLAEDGLAADEPNDERHGGLARHEHAPERHECYASACNLCLSAPVIKRGDRACDATRR